MTYAQFSDKLAAALSVLDIKAFQKHMESVGWHWFTLGRAPSIGEIESRIIEFAHDAWAKESIPTSISSGGITVQIISFGGREPVLNIYLGYSYGS